MNETRCVFPDDFTWGVATSAYQIEGSPLADGAGPSNWHEFAHSPGRVANNDTGDVACDHYRRYAEDIGIMRELGVSAYRFSVNWSRVFPSGTGALNRQGLAFYDRLVDELLAAEIEPHLTLFHWDLPAALEHQGGWLHADVPHWFADYAGAMVAALGDRVASWCTINEPWVVANHGYVEGIHPPGHQDLNEFLSAVHHLALGHQRAAQASRAAGASRVGLVVNLTPQHPASAAAEDVTAANRCHAYVNRLFLDPVFFGSYPQELKRLFGDHREDWRERELSPTDAALDFLGVNYYLRNVVRHAETGPTRSAEVIDETRARSAMGWEVYPEGLTEILNWVSTTYGRVPLFVTENGAAFDDPAPVDGMIRDERRENYLREHFEAAAAAIKRGINLQGYFVWSLLDNFEWSLGYAKRFGLVHVDDDTQNRTLKMSAHFYRRWIAGDEWA